MNALTPGTPCYLVALADYPELAGRVVEVVGPMPAPDGEQGQWYKVRAEWAIQMFPGRDTGAPRCNLIPIIPTGLAPPAARKRIPENVC